MSGPASNKETHERLKTTQIIHWKTKKENRWVFMMDMETRAFGIYPKIG